MLHSQSSLHTPEFAEEASQQDLERNLENDEGHGEKSWPADLPVHQVGEDSQVEGTDPQEVHKQEGQVEPLHVIGGQVDHVTSGHLAQGDLTQRQHLQDQSKETDGGRKEGGRKKGEARSE